jgi:hypothetical protein
VIGSTATNDIILGKRLPPSLANLLKPAAGIPGSGAASFEEGQKDCPPRDFPGSIEPRIQKDSSKKSLQDIPDHRVGHAFQPAAGPDAARYPQSPAPAGKSPAGNELALPPRQTSLGLQGEAFEQDLSRQKLQDGVSEELEPLIAPAGRGSGTMGQGSLHEVPVPELPAYGSPGRICIPGTRPGTRGYALPTTRVTLWPPKPKELLRA